MGAMEVDMTNGVEPVVGFMGGDKETVHALRKAYGRKITDIRMDYNFGETVALRITTDAGTLWLFDNGQSCCESRYFTTDDDLSHFVGAVLRNVEIRDGGDCKLGDKDDEEEEHEVEFMVIETSAGAFTIASHNEHNGYYGGISLRACWREL
jgi:hypothetical protein